MKATEEYIGSKQPSDIRIPEARTREMQDALSRYRPTLQRRAYQQLGNAADAEDAVQDALLSAYKHLDQFKGQAQMSTWLNAIVTNCARMQLRKRPRAIHLSLDEPLGDEQEFSLSEMLADRTPNPEDECKQSELRARLMQFVEQLSPSMRTAFQFRELDGLTTSEAAQVLGLAEGTVKAQLARARTNLTKLMRRALDPKRRSYAPLPSMAK